MFDKLGGMADLGDAPQGDQLMSAIEWVAEQIPGGFFIYRADDSQEMLYVNSATLRIFGCSTVDEFKELTGYTFRGLVHPDDFESIQASIDDQIADPGNENLDYVEYRIIRKDGAVRWVDDYGHFAHLPGYGDVYYVFIGDITEKHYAQEESRRRANVYAGMMEQFNALADNSLTVFRTNLTTGIIEEARGKDLYPTDFAGGSVADCSRVRCESFLNDGDRLDYQRIFDFDNLVERYYKGMGPATFVAFCRRHSGRQCFVKFSGSAVVDPVSGDAIAFGTETEYNAARVTEVLNEKVLVKQYDMVTYLVGDHYGVVIGDASAIKRGSIFPAKRDGSYAAYINDQVLPVAVGDEDEKAVLARELSLDQIERTLETEDSHVVDVTCLINGEVVNKRFTYYTVDRDAEFYILLKSDVTDLLREERERNEILANALREAEHANVAKTAFLSNMSHEIRTPMNAIIGYDSIALKNPDVPVETRDYLQKIGRSAKRLLGLINDILDMSRIESGRMMVKNEEFSFRDMIEQINTMVQSQCDDKGLSFECRMIGKVDDYYIGDDMKLKQVIINILSNAVKFTEAPGSITFSIEKTGEFRGKSTLRFSVQDTGVGMDPSFVPRIFDTFSQEDASSANKYGSTGLGMAITKNIVDMMNGSIAVESEKGVGSTFSVMVTLRNSAREAAARSSAVSKEMRILVVDDEEIACEHAKLVLEEVGISADSCLSGAEALRMIEVRHAKQEPYDLILMDWKMPGQDGLEVTREIRARYHDETTIVILTTYNWDDIMEEAIDAGIDGFMAKPLFASNVMSEFDKIVKRKGLGAEAPADLTGRRVLLAEDVQINAEIMEQVLGMRNMEVDHAENGKVACDMFAASAVGGYDAVLMDVRMPVMDGLEATAAIRALDRPDAKSVPIIALTANAFDEDVQHSLEVGMNAHLSKPVEIEQLYSTLEHFICGKNPGSGAAGEKSVS